MNRTYERIAILLAASGFSTSDIREFVRGIREMPPEAFIEYIHEIKGMLSQSKLYDSPRMYRDLSGVIRSSSRDRVATLLFDEAGLTKSAAVDALTEAIHAKYPQVLVPSESRKGFDAWIDKLEAQLPERTILHLATQIRNAFVHGREPDWRLTK